MSEVVPLAEAHDESRLRREGHRARERRRATGCRSRRARARRAPFVDAVAAGDERAIEQVVTAARSLRGAARGALVGGRRGRRRRELRRPAPHAAQRAVGRRPDRGGARDLVVGELRLGDHLPPARRPLHPPEHRRRRPVAARSRRRRGDVHAEPDQRGRRAADRGELGARRGRRRGPRDPRHASASTAPARCSSARRASRRSRSAPRPTAARSRRRSRRSASSSSASTTISSRSCSALAERCEEVYGPARDIEWAFADGQLYLLQCRAVTRAGSSPRPTRAAGRERAGRGDRARAVLRQHEPARRRRHRRAVQGASLRRGRDGHQGRRGRRRVLRDRVGRGDGLDRRPAARDADARATTSARSPSSTRARARRRSPRTPSSSATGSPTGSSGRSCRRTARSAGSSCRPSRGS